MALHTNVLLEVEFSQIQSMEELITKLIVSKPINFPGLGIHDCLKPHIASGVF